MGISLEKELTGSSRFKKTGMNINTVRVFG